MTLSLGERWRSCMNNAVGHCSEGTGGQRAQGANGSTGSVQAKYITAIPDAVEEAAAKALAAVRMPNYTWNDLDRGMQKYLRSDARAALRAGLAAWPGMFPTEMEEAAGVRRRIILPLPQEKQP